MTTQLKELTDGTVRGQYAAGFEPVIDAFRLNLEEHGDIGAAVSLYRHGDCVVDLWGGLADADAGKPWQRDTIVIAFSVAKGPTATCINRLVEQGQLDIDLPVAHYWPEFGANGKDGITTRMVLSHRAGLAAVDAELSLEQVLAWDPVIEAIAAQAPNWEPGSCHGYHARSYGWILGEILKRITGQTLGSYFEREIARPLGLRFWIGLPETELQHCARLIPPAGGSAAVADLLGADSLTARVMTGPNQLFGYNDMWNRPALLQAELPSSNGVGDARSLARLYAAVSGDIEGAQVLGSDQLAAACEPQSRGPDTVIFHETCFGLGYSLQPMVAPGAGPRAFGHPGAGGSTAFADPDAGLAMAYVTNTMKFDPAGDPRGTGLIAAAYACLA